MLNPTILKEASIIPISCLCIFNAVFNRAGSAIDYFPIAVKTPFQLYIAASQPICTEKKDEVSLPSEILIDYSCVLVSWLLKWVKKKQKQVDKG